MATISAAGGASVRERGAGNRICCKMTFSSAQPGRATGNAERYGRAGPRCGLLPSSSGADHSGCRRVAPVERIDATVAHRLDNHSRINIVGMARCRFEPVIRAVRLDLIKPKQRANRAVKDWIAPAPAGQPIVHLRRETMTAGDKCGFVVSEVGQRNPLRREAPLCLRRVTRATPACCEERQGPAFSPLLEVLWPGRAALLRSARRAPIHQRSRKRRRSRRSTRRTPNIRVRRRGTSTATAVSTSNRRKRANSSKATSARAAGASCLPRRPSPSCPRHFPTPRVIE